jgi:hypothetical protein
MPRCQKIDPCTIGCLQLGVLSLSDANKHAYLKVFGLSMAPMRCEPGRNTGSRQLDRIHHMLSILGFMMEAVSKLERQN